MKRDQRAKITDVNAHYISDAAFVLANAPPELAEQLRGGSVGMQEALRLLGRVTQRDRNRAKTQQVHSLCEAVLGDDTEQAKRIAAEIVLARDKYQRSRTGKPASDG